MKHRKGEHFSLDVLALALLTCLLASVVGMLVMGEDGKTVKRRLEIHHETVSLNEQLGQAQATLQQLACSHAGDGVITESDLQDAQAEAEELGRTLSELQQHNNEQSGAEDGDARKLAAAQAELKRLRDELAELKKTSAPKAGPGIHQIVGNFNGPYILIECINNAAMIYQANAKPVRISSNPKASGFENDMKYLLKHITEAGFVVFVVRPDGWFKNSYDALYPLITERLAAAGEKRVGTCKFPLAAGQPIGPFLPTRPEPSAEQPKGPGADAKEPAKPVPTI